MYMNKCICTRLYLAIYMPATITFKKYLVDVLKFIECDINNPRKSDNFCKKHGLEGCFREYDKDGTNPFYICRNGPLRNNTFGCFRHDHCHEKDYCHVQILKDTTFSYNLGISSLEFFEIGICIPVRTKNDPCPNLYCPQPLKCDEIQKRCYDPRNTLLLLSNPEQYYEQDGTEYQFLSINQQCQYQKHPFCALHLICNEKTMKCVKKCQTNLDCDSNQYCNTVNSGLGKCQAISPLDLSRKIAPPESTFIVLPWMMCLTIILFIILSNILAFFCFRKKNLYKRAWK